MKDKQALSTMVAVAIGTFMSALDSSVVNLIMPQIKEHFGVTLSAVEWIITAYLLVVSSLLLTFGRLSDLYGHKRVYETGFVIFTAGSLLCGLSVNVGMLIAFRVVQAVGAGMLYATGPAIITNAVPPEHRGKALSVTAVAVALGLSSGPIIGGTLSTLLGWQSIFYINVPIGLFGILLVVKNIPKDGATKKVPFDVAGSVLFFVALLLILLPLDLSGDHDVPPALFCSSVGAGLALIAAFVALERRRTHPMLETGLFRNRVFAASNAAAVFTYMAESIMVFLVPFYFQTLRGYSALQSGLLYMPLPLATLCVAPVSGSVSDRFDSRYISSFGALVMACGLFMLSFLGADSTVTYVIVCMVLTGLGFGMFQTPNNSAIMGNVPPAYRGTASGTLATMRNVGMVLGVAVSGALFSHYEERAGALFAAQGRTGTLLQDSVFTYALHYTFLAAGFVALVAMAASFTKGRVRPEKERE